MNSSLDMLLIGQLYSKNC